MPSRKTMLMYSTLLYPLISMTRCIYLGFFFSSPIYYLRPLLSCNQTRRRVDSERPTWAAKQNTESKPRHSKVAHTPKKKKRGIKSRRPVDREVLTGWNVNTEVQRLPSRNSDPGPHTRLSSSFHLPTTVRALHFYREKRSALPSLVDSCRILVVILRYEGALGR